MNGEILKCCGQAIPEADGCGYHCPKHDNSDHLDQTFPEQDYIDHNP